MITIFSGEGGRIWQQDVQNAAKAIDNLIHRRPVNAEHLCDAQRILEGLATQVPPRFPTEQERQ